jgi:hypothetical protein
LLSPPLQPKNWGTYEDGAGYEQGPIELALERSLVTRNRLSGSAPIEVEGGGVFTDFPITLDASRIVKNSPDQCSGC